MAEVKKEKKEKKPSLTAKYSISIGQYQLTLEHDDFFTLYKMLTDMIGQYKETK